MLWYISIAIISGCLASVIWGSRFLALRRSEVLIQHNFYVRRVLKVRLVNVYEEHLRDMISSGIRNLRLLILLALKWIYIKLKNSTGSLECRFIALMNMVRGKGVENRTIAPSKFIGELKNHKSSLEFPRS